MYRLLYFFARIYWFVFRPKTYGVKCIIENNGEVLLIKNSYGRGLWTFPGGGIKSGETAEGAAKREVREEVGIEVENVKWLGKFTSNSEYKKDNVDVFYSYSENMDFKIDKFEISEAGWFDPDNLPEVSEYTKVCLNLWKEKN